MRLIGQKQITLPFTLWVIWFSDFRNFHQSLVVSSNDWKKLLLCRVQLRIVFLNICFHSCGIFSIRTYHWRKLPTPYLLVRSSLWLIRLLTKEDVFNTKQPISQQLFLWCTWSASRLNLLLSHRDWSITNFRFKFVCQLPFARHSEFPPKRISQVASRLTAWKLDWNMLTFFLT